MATDASLLAIGVDFSQVSRATDALKGLELQSGRTDGAAGKLGMSSASLQGMIGKLGLAFSVVEGAIAAATVAGINYLDKLDEMAEKTGVSATNLGGLAYAATQSDTNLETLTMGMGKLTDKMQQADAGNKQAAASFETLGIKLRDGTGAMKSTDAVMMELATKFNSFPDGPEKSALAVDFFSKSGRELIPLLNRGGEGIAALRDEFIAITGDIDSTAAMASDFNDKLAAMKARSGAMFMAMAGQLLPALTTFVDIINESTGGTDIWRTAIDAAVWSVKVLISAVIGGVAVFQEMGKLLGGLAAALDALGHGEFKQAGAIWKETITDIKNINATATKDIDRVWAATAENVKKSTKSVGDATPPVVKLKDASKDFNDVLKGANETLAKAQTALDDWGKTASQKTSPSMQKLLEQMGDPKWKELSASEQQIVIDTYLAADAIDHLVAWMKEEIEKQEKSIAADEEAAVKKQAFIDKIRGVIDAMDDQNADMEVELGLLGKSKVEHDLAAAKIDFERQKRDLNNAAIELYGRDLSPEELAALQASYDKRVELIKKIDEGTTALANQQAQYDKMVSWLDGAGSSFFQSMGEGLQGIKKWASDLATTLKQTLLQVLYELTVKRWIISIAASATGINEAAAQTAGAAGNSWLTNLLTGGSTALNLGGSSFLGGLSSFMTGGTEAFSSLGATFNLLASGGTLEAIGGLPGLFSTVGSALTAALPIIGGLLAIGAMTGLFDFSGGGGPKQAGAYNQGIPGFNMYPGETTGEGNAAMAQAVKATQTSYQAILAATGGKGTAKFGLSYDVDPQGTAQSRVSAAAMVNGRQVYNVRDRDVGRDPEELQRNIELEAKRSLLSALQASDLPADIATIFNSISASSATAEAIDRVLAFGMAVGSVNSLLANIDQIVPDLEKLANMTIASTFADAGESLQKLMDSYDGSVEQTEALTAASAAYYNSLVKLIAQIQQVKGAVDAMFGSSKEQIYLAGRDDAFMKNYYQAQATASSAMIDTLSDPGMIQKQSEKWNEAIMKQWEMLSPEEQVKQRDAYMQMISDAQTKVDDRLKELSDKAQADAKDMLTKVHDLLMEAATKMDTAANTQQSAANTQQDAANTPVQVNVDVDVSVSDDRVDANAQVATA